MAKCGYCGTMILFGGVQAGGQRFCNNKCHQSAYVLSVAQHVPPDVLQQQVRQLHQGACPKCGGRGPVDVHRIYRVWSALVLTQWSNSPQVSCRPCATKSQIGGVFFCLFLGWWGFPWGLVLTPIQITRNVVGIFGGPDPKRASGDLEKLVKVNLGVKLIEASRQMESTRQPPPLPER